MINVKAKVKYSCVDIEYIAEIIGRRINELNAILEKDPKEINIFRFIVATKLYKKFYNKHLFNDSNSIKMNLKIDELIVLKYCLVKENQRDTSWYLTQIDKYIHPKIFDRL